MKHNFLIFIFVLTFGIIYNNVVFAGNYYHKGGNYYHKGGYYVKTIASFYSCCSRTANGEKFNPNGLTAAHRTLKFNSRVRVINLNNGRSVIVRINDRGPINSNRGIDISRGAARMLKMNGIAPVRLEKL